MPAGKLGQSWPPEAVLPIKGLAVSEVISQPAPTLCIQEPVFEAIEAIHSIRNTL